MFHTIEEAIQDLKEGKIIIVCDDKHRENEGDFVALAEKVTDEHINFMITHGRGLVCAPISPDLAETFGLHPMTRENTETHGTAFTVSIDHKSVTTGISAKERADTIRALAAPNSSKEAFNKPGHVFPLIAREWGVLERAGHTEAAVDLARLCGAQPAGVICEIMNPDGTMARIPQLEEIANRFNLKMITIFWVPGAFEIPLIAKKLAESHKYDAVIALGAVIRGATTHYDYVCNETAKGISQASLSTGVPVIFGIVTTENIEQAIERAGTKSGNKGWDSAVSAIEMANLLKTIG